MRSIDTNVLARWVMRDDPGQTKIADRIIDQPIEITHTVLLEVGWILTSIGRMSREQFADTVVRVLDLETATIQRRMALRWAVDRYRAGADWADVLHIVSTDAGQSFATFDKALLKEAGASTPVRVEVLSA